MTQAIHPRILEVELEHHREWAMACWFDPGPAGLRGQLEQMLRATFLAELSQKPSIALAERYFKAVQVLVFDELADSSRDVITEFGFEPTSFVPDEYVERMSTWKKEARDAGVAIASSPESVFKAGIERPDMPIWNKLAEIEGRMTDKLDGEVFGESPGGPSKLMATFLRQHFNVEITPDQRGLQSLELLLVQETPGVCRWMPPVLFQAFCDFVGVVLQAEHGLTVQWALSTPDETGISPPPMLRVQQRGSYRHIPIGRLLVDWCVMPRDSNDPTVAERIRSLASSPS
ncbi:MAG: hypothetical protein ACLFVJ_01170 [Persicimonas sp.]